MLRRSPAEFFPASETIGHSRGRVHVFRIVAMRQNSHVFMAKKGIMLEQIFLHLPADDGNGSGTSKALVLQCSRIRFVKWCSIKVERAVRDPCIAVIHKEWHVMPFGKLACDQKIGIRWRSGEDGIDAFFGKDFFGSLERRSFPFYSAIRLIDGLNELRPEPLIARSGKFECFAILLCKRYCWCTT